MPAPSRARSRDRSDAGAVVAALAEHRDDLLDRALGDAVDLLRVGPEEAERDDDVAHLRGDEGQLETLEVISRRLLSCLSVAGSDVTQVSPSS